VAELHPMDSMRSKRHKGFFLNFGSWKTLRVAYVGPRQSCQGRSWCSRIDGNDVLDGKCAQTRLEDERRTKSGKQLDCQAAMLQAISIGKGIPMLEPWIIDEIRRREEERRRGDRPQLELPVPDSRWPGDWDEHQREQGDRAPERGVVIIGM